MRLTLFAWVLCVLIASCSSQSDKTIAVPIGEIDQGGWLLSLQLNDSVSLPVDVQVINDSNMVFINGEERLTAKIRFITSDSLHILMPFFETGFRARIAKDRDELNGLWYNFAKDNYSIPFSAQANVSIPFDSVMTGSELASQYEVHFSHLSEEDHYPAIGLFNVSTSGRIQGTFITETGDYRYLSGGLTGKKLMLSCFDGSHAFIFTASLSGDSLLNGHFYSGKHWEEPWLAWANPHYGLRDPYQLTEVVDSAALGLTRFIRADGSSLTLDEIRRPGEVSIIQVMGSWCPNCLDESRFFKELYTEYHPLGLRILPLSFESSSDIGPAFKAIHKLEKDLQLPFPIYYGGTRKKSSASEALPALNHVMSYPTSIFIAKDGTVRKVHTGFYGPSTGAYYSRYTEMTHALIRSMLSES